MMAWQTTPFRCGRRPGGARSRRGWRCRTTAGPVTASLALAGPLRAVRDHVVRAHDCAGRLHGRRALRWVGCALPRWQSAGSPCRRPLPRRPSTAPRRRPSPGSSAQHTRQRARLLQDLRQGRNDPHVRRDVEARVPPYLLIGTNGAAGPALVRDSGAPRATTGWALDRIEDRNGNAAMIDYTRTEGNAAEQWWTELRPARISYAPNRQSDFIYDMGRPDPWTVLRWHTHPHRCPNERNRDVGRTRRRRR